MSFSFAEVPLENRCYQSRFAKYRNWPVGDCFFGAPSDGLYGRKPLTELPRNSTGFHFYLGSERRCIFESYLASSCPQATKSLHIGDSCYALGEGREYARLTESLLQCSFPKLRSLELGVWQLFSNSHCAYGDVGQIDGLGTSMPELRELYIYGKCQLLSPLSIPNLEILHIVVDDPATGLNAGAPDEKTVSNILSSSFPKLRKLYIDLEIDNANLRYSIPETLLASNAFPHLTDFELVGNFGMGERERLLNSPLLYNQRVTVHLNGMRELT